MSNLRDDRFTRWVLCGVLLVLAGGVRSLGQETAKSPVPDEGAQQGAMKLIREVYGERMDAAKTKLDKLKLCYFLLNKARESSNDKPMQHALLREAGRLAIEGGGPELGMMVVDEMNQAFVIKSIEMKLRVLKKMVAEADTDFSAYEGAEVALPLIQEAVGKEDYEMATELGKVALAAAQRSDESAFLTGYVRDVLTRLETLQKAYQDVSKAREVLEKEPANPQANLAVGRYLCFVKGDWERGLPMLFLGSDAGIRAIAQQELKGPVTNNQQLEIGDAWWLLAENEAGDAKEQFYLRAAHWYRKVLPGLTGVSKDKIERRLSRIPASQSLFSVRPGIKPASKFGCRKRSARKVLVWSGGGTKQSERAVAAALFWLAKHQSANGSWDLAGYNARCKDATCTGPGNGKHDSGATAMGLLPFLAAGQTHESKGPYQRNIKAGVYWLLGAQKPNGDLRAGSSMYSHGLASIALCECYGMTGDKKVGKAAQMALNFIMKSQDKNGGGWRYEPGQAGDTSVIGWQIMALKSGQMASLNVSPTVFGKAKQFLKSTSSGQYGGQFGYMPGSGGTTTMTGVGLLCSQYLKVPKSDPAMIEGTAFLMKNMPDNAVRNLYYWYYATQVMHNIPGPDWDAWNRKMRQVLIDSQVKAGCASGSWDPQGDQWGSAGGRVMMTALSALTLEVYYRYVPVYDYETGGDADARQGDP